jgi:hypothetical protein
MLISALQDAAKEFHRDKNRTIGLVAKEYNFQKKMQVGGLTLSSIHEMAKY